MDYSTLIQDLMLRSLSTKAELEKIESSAARTLGGASATKTADTTTNPSFPSFTPHDEMASYYEWSMNKQLLYDVIMDSVFKSKYPSKSSTMAFQIYKSIWLKTPEKFKVISDLHQNSFRDLLHFSVEVDVADGWNHRLHFNGYWKDRFILCNIDAGTIDYSKHINETVWEAGDC